MSLVNIANINVLNNPAPFNSPLEFEITFECNAELKDGKRDMNLTSFEGNLH